MTSESHRDHLRRFANQQRDLADEVASHWGVDDPLYPPLQWPQVDADWLAFVERVARPLVEADGDDAATQAAMREWRKKSPYSLAVALVFAANRVRTEAPR